MNSENCAEILKQILHEMREMRRDVGNIQTSAASSSDTLQNMLTGFQTGAIPIDAFNNFAVSVQNLGQSAINNTGFSTSLDAPTDSSAPDNKTPNKSLASELMSSNGTNTVPVTSATSSATNSAYTALKPSGNDVPVSSTSDLLNQCQTLMKTEKEQFKELFPDKDVHAISDGVNNLFIAEGQNMREDSTTSSGSNSDLPCKQEVNQDDTENQDGPTNPDDPVNQEGPNSQGGSQSQGVSN